MNRFLAVIAALVLTACSAENPLVPPPPTATPAPPPVVVVQPTVTPAPVAPTATPPAPTATPRPASPTPAQPGQPSVCPDTGTAQTAIGLNVVRLGTEACAWTWRSNPLISVERTVPSGYIGTLHLTDDKIVVTEGTGQKLVFQGATFRFVAAYPAGDAVYDRCALLRKEQAFGQQERPSFTVEPLGFNCP